MLCYRDRTFCSADCTTPNCPDAITPDVIEKATVWSAGFGFDGALIASRDMSANCRDYAPAVPIDGLEPRFGHEPVQCPTTEL